MAFAFQIDAVTMTTQPTEVIVQEAPASRSQAATGGYLFSKRSKGAIITVIWGVGAATTAVLAELRTKRNSLVNHTISWTDAGSTAQSYDVGWDAEPPYTERLGNVFKPIRITFYERP